MSIAEAISQSLWVSSDSSSTMPRRAAAGIHRWASKPDGENSGTRGAERVRCGHHLADGNRKSCAEAIRAYLSCYCKKRAKSKGR
jgi:hypothetical protein